MRRRVASNAARGFRALGVDARRVQASLRGLPQHMKNRREYARTAGSSAFRFERGPAYPCLADRFDDAGVATGQYFHQDLLVAQWVHAAEPRRHVDVGSRVDGFVAHVATFREIEVLDIRPMHSDASNNIRFHQHDLTRGPGDFIGSTDSLSCLHALEHFGLGRYGDEVDPDGWWSGWQHLRLMLEPQGSLYFSVPLGERQRVEFDAHRIFALPFVLDQLVAPHYDLVSFSYVDDAGELHRDVDPRSAPAQRTFGLQMGCGIFRLRLR